MTYDTDNKLQWYCKHHYPIMFKYDWEASVAERLSYPLCKPGVVSSISGFSSLSKWDFKPRSRLRMTFAVGGTLNPNTTTTNMTGKMAGAIN